MAGPSFPGGAPFGLHRKLALTSNGRAVRVRGWIKWQQRMRSMEIAAGVQQEGRLATGTVRVDPTGAPDAFEVTANVPDHAQFAPGAAVASASATVLMVDGSTEAVELAPQHVELE